MRVAHYFAYGSNMNPARVRTRGLRVRAILGGRLSGFDLAFDKQSPSHAGTGHANLVHARAGCAGEGCAGEGCAEGVLYELVSTDEILRMDPFEHAPVNYSREVVTVATVRGPIDAWTYFANAAVRSPGARPERAYLEHLLRGRPWLSETWYARLAAWPTADGPP